MNIQELKLKSSEQLITQAEELGIENASTLRKQEILFAILKKVAEKEEITGVGVLQLCLLYTSPSPRDRQKSRMPSSA